MDVKIDAIYLPSTEIVIREIEGEMIIIPLLAGIGDMEDELYTLNETAKEIWSRFGSRKTLTDIIEELTVLYNADQDVIREDVVGLTKELLERGILTEKSD